MSSRLPLGPIQTLPMGTGDSFPEGKAAGARNWPLISDYCRDLENVGLYIRSPYVFMAKCLVKYRSHFALPYRRGSVVVKALRYKPEVEG
jgi:hypothetical protein